MPRRDYLFDDDDDDDDSQEPEPISRLAFYGAVRMYHSVIHAMYEMRPLLRDAGMTNMSARQASRILERVLARHAEDLERAG